MLAYVVRVQSCSLFCLVIFLFERREEEGTTTRDTWDSAPGDCSPPFLMSGNKHVLCNRIINCA